MKEKPSPPFSTLTLGVRMEKVNGLSRRLDLKMGVEKDNKN